MLGVERAKEVVSHLRLVVNLVRVLHLLCLVLLGGKACQHEFVILHLQLLFLLFLLLRSRSLAELAA